MIKHLIRAFIDAPILALIFAGVIAVVGLRALRDNPKDAIPDIAENQTIVFTEWMGRSPKDVDEQVTYPLSTAMLAAMALARSDWSASTPSSSRWNDSAHRLRSVAASISWAVIRT